MERPLCVGESRGGPENILPRSQQKEPPFPSISGRFPVAFYCGNGRGEFERKAVIPPGISVARLVRRGCSMSVPFWQAA